MEEMANMFHMYLMYNSFICLKSQKPFNSSIMLVMNLSHTMGFLGMKPHTWGGANEVVPWQKNPSLVG